MSDQIPQWAVNEDGDLFYGPSESGEWLTVHEISDPDSWVHPDDQHDALVALTNRVRDAAKLERYREFVRAYDAAPHYFSEIGRTDELDAARAALGDIPESDNQGDTTQP